MGSLSSKLCNKNKSNATQSKLECLVDYPGTPSNKNNKDDILLVYSCELPNYVAVLDYVKKQSDEICLYKNDLIYLINNKNKPRFNLVKNLRTNLVGHVPANAIKPYIQLRKQEWFYPNISRNDADRFLKRNDDNPRGCYIIRDSSNLDNSYALSVLNIEPDSSKRVYHYLIKRDDNRCYFIDSNAKVVRSFRYMEELIDHYKAHKELCTKLTNYCQRTGDWEVEWEMDIRNIYFREDRESKLGGGNFGDVYKGVLLKKYTVAIKKLKRTHSKEESELFIEECNKMKRLKHPNIVQLYCVCTKHEPHLIVLEYMCNGSLKNYLKEQKSKLSIKDLIDMITQIAQGMKYLESIKLVHRDLAARNILVGKDNLVKIADFGLADKLSKTGKIYSSLTHIPIKWVAPEVYALNQVYTVKSDVWSFAILLYEIITLGQDPYPNMDNDQVKESVKLGYRMEKPIGCSDNYYEIMIKCWNAEPENRPTFETLYNWFYDDVKKEQQYLDY